MKVPGHRPPRSSRRRNRDQPGLAAAVPARGPDARVFAYVVSSVFLIVAVIGMLHHEMWRDEYQAWLVARDAHALPDLFRNLRYEGNPALWHLLLFPLTAITHDARAMQVLHLLIAVAFVFVFNRYAPFPAVWKVLLTFGYYALFEFTLISRGYGLGLLLVFIACALFPRRDDRLLWMALVLALLANTTVFGLLLCVCFAGVLCVDRVAAARVQRPGRASAWVVTLFLIIVAIGAATAAWQIYPEPDSTFPVSYATGAFQPARLNHALSRVLTAYFALPRLDQPHFWNTNVLDGLSSENGRLSWFAIGPWLSLLTIGTFGLYFRRRPLGLLLYLGGTAALLAFFYYTAFTQARYASHFFVVLVGAMWLSADPAGPPAAKAKPRSLPSLGDTAGRWLFFAMLAVSCVGGVGAYYQDVRRPFSTSGDVARFLTQQKLIQDDIVGVTDFTSSPIAALLDRQLYYPQRHGDGSFVVWDGRRIGTMFYPQIIEQVVDRMRNTAKGRLVLLLDRPMPFVDPTTHVTRPFLKGLLTKDLALELIDSVPAGIVDDETYSVYLITPFRGGGR